MKNKEMKIESRDFSWTSPFKWGFPRVSFFNINFIIMDDDGDIRQYKRGDL